jgi:hypothetical protein
LYFVYLTFLSTFVVALVKRLSVKAKGTKARDKNVFAVCGVGVVRIPPPLSLGDFCFVYCVFWGFLGNKGDSKTQNAVLKKSRNRPSIFF